MSSESERGIGENFSNGSNEDVHRRHTINDSKYIIGIFLEDKKTI